MPNCDEIHRFSLVQDKSFVTIPVLYRNRSTIHVQTKLNNDVLSAFIQQFTSHNTVLG